MTTPSLPPTVPEYWVSKELNGTKLPDTALQRFVQDNEPAGIEDEDEFRAGLQAVINEVWASALAADRAATAPDERAAFEAWARATHDFNPRWSGQSYWGAPGIDSAWLAWQARAALTAPDRAANSLAAPDLLPPAFQHAQEMVAFADSPPVGVGREAEHGSVDSVERLSQTPAWPGRVTE